MITALKIPLIACGAMALLTACAEMDWTKPGADKAATSNDLEHCRGVALGRSTPQAVAAERGTTTSGVIAPARPAGTANERVIAEHEAVRQCMQAKGYQLTPAR
jgi:hypothetical protein